MTTSQLPPTRTVRRRLAAAESEFSRHRLFCGQCATGFPCDEHKALKELRDAAAESAAALNGAS